MTTAIEAASPPSALSPGWLRSRDFDLGFIGGTALLALVSGAVVVADPSLFLLVLMLDLWLLGYHHVVSTFTRLCFDRESFRTHRFLVVWAPLGVLAGVTAMAVGGLPLASVYLYWQCFHYTRQSYGIAQIYKRKADCELGEPAWLERAAIYLLPLWGILHRSQQGPDTFLGAPLVVVQWHS